MKSFFIRLEKKCNFTILQEPERLRGGYMHKMYALHTTKGNYAIKLLNPFVMRRETAMRNYAAADQLEKVLEEQKIPILPSLCFDGKKMQEIDGQYFYLFEYYDGRALCGKEITAYHCREMGAVLAKIHNIDRKAAEGAAEPINIDWDFYITEMQKRDKKLYELLSSTHALLLKSQKKGNLARKKLPNISAICHNDMDCKNVLWKGREYRIIDLECLSYQNPMTECFELALCWSGYEECNIDFSLFRAFLMEYSAAGGTLPSDWEVLYDCNNGRLEWLEYNIKRVLGMDCQADEQEVGFEQVIETVKHIIYYDRVREQILNHCDRITKSCSKPADFF